MPLTVQRRADPDAVDRLLRGLPDWFGDEDAILGYVADAATLPSYLAVDDGSVRGVALIHRHFPDSAELHLVAVDPAAHRSGIGTALLHALEQDLAGDGVRMLQVHTVGASFLSPGYARTREFYLARGFVPLQEFHGIDWPGPTLVLAKAITP